MKTILIAITTLLLMSCNAPLSEPEGQPANNGALQCGKDTDCKGERICDAGKCVSPLLDNKATNAGIAPQTNQLVSKAKSVLQPTPVCMKGDRRTRIPVWRPTVNREGYLSSRPPQLDGMIVYIELFQDASEVSCKDSELNSFSSPDDVRNPMAGGLAVNVRGNTQRANGTCYFRGYYMNEDVMGMHQGWIETYFKAVEKEKIVLSDKYCAAEPLN